MSLITDGHRIITLSAAWVFILMSILCYYKRPQRNDNDKMK